MNKEQKTLSTGEQQRIKDMLAEMQNYIMDFECSDAIKANILGNTIRIWRIIK